MLHVEEFFHADFADEADFISRKVAKSQSVFLCDYLKKLSILVSQNLRNLV